MTNRYDQYRNNKYACLQGLTVNSHNVAFSVNEKHANASKVLQTLPIAIPDTKLIFGEGSFYTSDFTILRNSKFEDNIARPAKRDDASNSVSTNSSYQFPVLKSSSILNPSQQKAVAAIELMNNYNKLSGTELTIANNGSITNTRRGRSPIAKRKILSSSTPNLKTFSQVKSTVKIPKLLKEELSVPSTNIAGSDTIPDNLPSFGSLHEIQGLHPSKSLLALPVKILAFDDSDNEKGSPSKDKLHNFLSKLSSPTAASSSDALPANRLQGRGLTKNSSTRISQSPPKSAAELNIPLQLRTSTVSSNPPSRPGSPPRDEARTRLTSANIIIPANKSNLATESALDDEGDLAPISTGELNTSPSEVFYQDISSKMYYTFVDYFPCNWYRRKAYTSLTRAELLLPLLRRKERSLRAKERESPTSCLQTPQPVTFIAHPSASKCRASLKVKTSLSLKSMDSAARPIVEDTETIQTIILQGVPKRTCL